MKWTVVSALAGAVVLSGCIGTAPVNKAALPASATSTVFGHTVPEGAPVGSQAVVTSKYVATHSKLAAEPWRVAHFRPNLNMPEFLLGSDLLELAESGNPAAVSRKLENSDALAMTIPRLKVIPCDEGCVGNKSYDKTVADFIKTYEEIAQQKSVSFRGTLPVKVRWFVEKSFLQRMNPLSMQDEVFAIQLGVEGNVLTISRTSFGEKSKVKENAVGVANYLRWGVITPMAFGLRNYATIRLSPEYQPGAMENLDNWGKGITKSLRNMMGRDDYRSRLETPTEKDKDLFPAMDGIAPGEGRKLEATHFFESL